MIVKELEKFKELTDQFSVVIDCFASSINKPLMYDSSQIHAGFRYGKPEAKHFCMLKAVRAVSGLNAVICLAEKGFNQEIFVLLRTIVECTAHIEFVLAGLAGEALAKKQEKVVEAFFADFRRNGADDYKGQHLRQEDVHKEISRYIEELGVTGKESRFAEVSAKDLMSNIYRNFSNYVHARYPEVMDMYGGDPAKFHMNGMSGTQKDRESVAAISVFVDSVSLTLGHMIQKFDMRDAMKDIDKIAHWFPNEEGNKREFM